MPHIVILGAAGTPTVQDGQVQGLAGFPGTTEEAAKLVTMIADAGTRPPPALGRLRDALSARMAAR